MPLDTKSSSNHWPRQISIVSVILLMGLLLVACGTQQQGEIPTLEPTPDTLLTEPTDDILTEPTDDMLTEPTGTLDATTGTDMDEQISLSDIADNPEAYIGQTATVTGEVSSLINAQAFRMNEDNLLDIGDEILVLYVQDTPMINLTEETSVRVTGTVTNFVQADIENQYGFDLDDTLFAEFEDRPAIIADEIDLVATVSEIADEPEAYIGNLVTVRGDVAEVIGAQAFRMNDPAFLSDDSLLVLTSNQDMVVNEGDSVEVTGTIERFDIAIIERQASDAENLDELFSDMTDEVMLQAQNVEMIQPEQ